MEHAVGLHVHRYPGALDGDADIVEAAVVQQADVAQGAVHQGLGGDAAVFLQQLPLQGAAVDADADGNAPVPAGVGHGPDLFRGADVAGVDTDLVHPLADALQGQAIVKVDVRHQGDVDAAADGADGPGGVHIRHRHPDDLAPGPLQAEDLGDGTLHVLGGGIAHGLDADRRAAAHGHGAHMNLLAHGLYPPCE